MHSTSKTRLGMASAVGAALLTFGFAAPVHAAGGGANSGCGSYCPSNIGAPSDNGVATNQPAAGTKGEADSKNPPGQVDSQHSRGYECNVNAGIGRSNPAHTGCYVPPSDEGSGDNSGTGVVECYPCSD